MTPAPKMGRTEVANRQKLGDARVDALKAKNAQFQAAKKSGNLAQFRKDNPKLSGRERAQQMAKARIAAKNAPAAKPAPQQAQAKPTTQATQAAPTPSGDKLKAGSFGISQKGREQAAANRAAVTQEKPVAQTKQLGGRSGAAQRIRAKREAEVTQKPTANTVSKPESSVPAGSFGISQKGKEQAAKNKAEVASKNNQSDSGNVASKNNQSGSGNIVTYKGKKINLDTVGPKTKEFLQRKTTGTNLSNKVKDAGIDVKFTRDKDGTISGASQSGGKPGEVISTGGTNSGSSSSSKTIGVDPSPGKSDTKSVVNNNKKKNVKTAKNVTNQMNQLNKKEAEFTGEPAGKVTTGKIDFGGF